MDGRKDRYAAKRAGPLCCRLPMACAEACDGWFCRQSPTRLSQCGAGAMARGQNLFLRRARCTAGNRRRSAVSGLSGGIAANRQLCLDNCGHSFYYDRRASDAQRYRAAGKAWLASGGADRGRPTQYGGRRRFPAWRQTKRLSRLKATEGCPPFFQANLPPRLPALRSGYLPPAGFANMGQIPPDRAVDRAGRGLNRIVPAYRRALPPHPEGDRRETTDASLPGLRQRSTGGSAF